MSALIATVLTFTGALPAFAADINSQQEPVIVSERTYNLPSQSPDTTITVRETTYSNGVICRDTLTGTRVLDPAPIGLMPRNETGKVYASLKHDCYLYTIHEGTAKLYATFLFDHDNKIARVYQGNASDPDRYYCDFNLTCSHSEPQYDLSTGGQKAFVKCSFRIFENGSSIGWDNEWMQITSDYDGYLSYSEN